MPRWPGPRKFMHNPFGGTAEMQEVKRNGSAVLFATCQGNAVLADGQIFDPAVHKIKLVFRLPDTVVVAFGGKSALIEEALVLMRQLVTNRISLICRRPISR